MWRSVGGTWAGLARQRRGDLLWEPRTIAYDHNHDAETFMDEEIKSSLDALESRVSATKKRFDDVKWYIGGASVIFSALTLVLGWNFSGERNALRDAVKDMKEEVRDTLTRLGQAAVPPQLVLLGPDANPLADQRLKGDVQRKDDGTTMLSSP